MKEGPDIRSDSREPVQIDIYLNMLYSYFVSLYLYECLGPSEVRRRLKFFFTCSVFVYVSKVIDTPRKHVNTNEQNWTDREVNTLET